MFETCADFIKFAGLSDEYRDFCNTWPVITNTIPDLSVWLCSHTSKVLEYKTAWPKLLSVVLFLMDNPKPKCYLRELPIPGIDSKFIEQHKSILRDLLDELLISDHINSETQGFLNHGFERRYGFKYPEPLIRFRILDASVFGYPITDMSLPLSQFITLTLPVEHIIVTENKINGLSFPDIDRAIIIFGLGYGLQSLAAIPWFMDKDIYYWGDIDTHGFAMLSQFRSYYPQVRNLLMNEQTLKTFQLMAVEEPEDKRCKATLMHLTNAEQMLYEALCQNSHGKNIRIEQERIDFKYVETYLKQIFIL